MNYSILFTRILLYRPALFYLSHCISLKNLPKEFDSSLEHQMIKLCAQKCVEVAIQTIEAVVQIGTREISGKLQTIGAWWHVMLVKCFLLVIVLDTNLYHFSISILRPL